MAKPDAGDAFMSQKEAAAFLGSNQATVCRWITAGVLPHGLRPGSPARLLKRADVERSDRLCPPRGLKGNAVIARKLGRPSTAGAETSAALAVLLKLIAADGRATSRLQAEAGLSGSAIYGIVLDKIRNPSMGTVAAILAALGTTCADLDGDDQ